MIPVTTDIRGQRWLVLGAGDRALNYQQSLRAVGAELVQIKRPESGSPVAEQVITVETTVAIEPLLADNRLEGVICFDRALLSPLQRQKIKQAGVLLWLADSPAESSVIFPDALDSPWVPVLLCIDADKQSLISRLKQLLGRLRSAQKTEAAQKQTVFD